MENRQEILDIAANLKIIGDDIDRIYGENRGLDIADLRNALGPVINNNNNNIIQQNMGRWLMYTHYGLILIIGIQMFRSR